jgi:hypothetical protein
MEGIGGGFTTDDIARLPHAVASTRDPMTGSCARSTQSRVWQFAGFMTEPLACGCRRYHLICFDADAVVFAGIPAQRDQNLNQVSRR